jgi:hypothetical protein
MYYAAQDIMEYLFSSAGGGAQDSEHRLLRQAAHHAYRDVMNARDWRWHIAEGSLTGADAITLPPNVKNVDALIAPITHPTDTIFIEPSEWTRIDTLLPQINSPVYWTVMRHPTLPDQWQIRMAGSPPGVTFRYTYRRKPKPLQYMGYEPACREAGFAPSGAVRRYGTANAYPEGFAGIQQATAQEIIGLAGSMIGSPPANAKTVVSDYIDASDTMFTAILSSCEVWLSKLMGKNVEGAMSVQTRDLRLAMEADNVAPYSGRSSGGGRLGVARALGYYSPSGPDN